jgi:hypothetical protein
MNTFHVPRRYAAFPAILVFLVSAGAQDKPRVFMAGRGSINGMTNGSAVGALSGGGWWSSGRTDSIVDSHDESMELTKNFAANCTGAQVTVNPDAADYVTSLNRESKAKKGVFSKNNQIQVSNKAGDVLLSSSVRSVATAAKDACNLILSDFAAHGHARSSVSAPPRTNEADRTSPLPPNAITRAVPVPAKIANHTNLESEAGVGASHDKASQEIKPPPAHPLSQDPSHTATMLGDYQEEGSIGAWSEEKPWIRRDGVIISRVVPGGPADHVGIQQGDFVLAIDDHYVFTGEELSVRIRLYKAGQRVRIRYRHNATICDADLTMDGAK